MGEFILKGLYQLQTADLKLMRIKRRQLLIGGRGSVSRQKVAGVDVPGQPVSANRDGGHHIQAKQGKVCQIVPGKGFAAEMGMNAP